MTKKFRSNKRTITSTGANVSMGSSIVSLLSATTRVENAAQNAASNSGWGGYSKVLPNEAAAMVVTDPSELKAPLEHRNKVLAKLVRVLGDSLDSTSDCIRRGREIEKELHAGCIGKRDYKLAAVERILRIETSGDEGSSCVSTGAAGDMFGAPTGPATSARRDARLPLAAGEAAARKTAATLPAKLRRLDGDKRAMDSFLSTSAHGGSSGGTAYAVDEESRVRQKAVERLQLLLWRPATVDGANVRSGEGHDEQDDSRAGATAKAIEEALFFELAASDGGMPSYRRQLRAILFNLSAEAEDSAELREALLSGQIRPDETPTLTATQMASRVVRAKKEELAEQGLQKATFQKSYPEPGIFTCEKCGSERCWHTESQIQRGDEAMTVFITCADCGHRFAEDRGF